MDYPVCRFNALRTVQEWKSKLYYIPMDILHNNSLINEIVDKLFKNRRTDYSEFALENTLAFSEMQHQVFHVTNHNYEKLHASLFKKTPHPEQCILFMHGYGSNRLECANILRVLPQQWALCAFDFSGSGKSEGDLITYGMKEKQDINSMLGHLRQTGYKRFVLWGRSMGATSALLYSLRYSPQDILLQVVDSPFYSFEMIAFEIASKNVKAPEFVISFALQLAKKNCAKFQYNPFDIDLKDVGECQVPALFLYCQEDTVINCQNTHLICSKYKAVFEKLAIPENHNTVRTQTTLDKVFQFIDKYSKKSKKTDPSPYFDKQQRIESTPVHTHRKTHSRGEKSVEPSEKGSLRKGIERVNVDNNGNKFDDYGLWMTNKLTGQSLNTPQTNNNKRKSGSLKRAHLSLSSSFAAKNIKEIESVLSPSFQHELSKDPTMSLFKSDKERKWKKISTVKSLGNSQCLTNSKYL